MMEPYACLYAGEACGYEGGGEGDDGAVLASPQLGVVEKVWIVLGPILLPEGLAVLPIGAC